jgi:hypothetical protein
MAQIVMSDLRHSSLCARIGESFTAFQRRLSDHDLGALAGLEPAKKRVREEIEAGVRSR